VSPAQKKILACLSFIIWVSIFSPHPFLLERLRNLVLQRVLRVRDHPWRRRSLARPFPPFVPSRPKDPVRPFHPESQLGRRLPCRRAFPAGPSRPFFPTGLPRKLLLSLPLHLTLTPSSLVAGLSGVALRSFRPFRYSAVGGRRRSRRLQLEINHWQREERLCMAVLMRARAPRRVEGLDLSCHPCAGKGEERKHDQIGRVQRGVQRFCSLPDASTFYTCTPERGLIYIYGVEEEARQLGKPMLVGGLLPLPTLFI